jgi:hypothetical protein
MAEFHELVRFVAGDNPDRGERPIGGRSGGREAPRAAVRGDPAGSAGGGAIPLGMLLARMAKSTARRPVTTSLTTLPCVGTH